MSQDACRCDDMHVSRRLPDDVSSQYRIKFMRTFEKVLEHLRRPLISLLIYASRMLHMCTMVPSPGRLRSRPHSLRPRHTRRIGDRSSRQSHLLPRAAARHTAWLLAAARAVRARRREHSGGERHYDGREERDDEPGARQKRPRRRRGSRRKKAARRLRVHTCSRTRGNRVW